MLAAASPTGSVDAAELGGFELWAEDAGSDVASRAGDLAELVQEVEPAQIRRPELPRDAHSGGAEARGDAQQSVDEVVCRLLERVPVPVRVAPEPQAAAPVRLDHPQRRRPGTVHGHSVPVDGGRNTLLSSLYCLAIAIR